MSFSLKMASAQINNIIFDCHVVHVRLGNANLCP